MELSQLRGQPGDFPILFGTVKPGFCLPHILLKGWSGPLSGPGTCSRPNRFHGKCWSEPACARIFPGTVRLKNILGCMSARLQKVGSFSPVYPPFLFLIKVIPLVTCVPLCFY